MHLHTYITIANSVVMLKHTATHRSTPRAQAINTYHCKDLTTTHYLWCYRGGCCCGIPMFKWEIHSINLPIKCVSCFFGCSSGESNEWIGYFKCIYTNSVKYAIICFLLTALCVLVCIIYTPLNRNQFVWNERILLKALERWKLKMRIEVEMNGNSCFSHREKTSQ